MKTLTQYPEESISISRGVADILELPGARRQLNFFIRMSPSVIRTAWAFVGGHKFGFGEGDAKSERPSKNNAGVEDLMASKENDVASMRAGKESNVNNIADVSGDLLMAGMSLMGSLGSSFFSNTGKGQQKAPDVITNIVTNVIENLLESGALREELFLGLDDHDDDEFDDNMLTNENDDENKLKKKLEEPKKATENPKFTEPDHQDL
uniref:Uncharacterized protein n=1 Tax=Lygus hesperus TaxID=30085 RepID=A0A0K8SNZ2_LYGHE